MMIEEYNYLLAQQNGGPFDAIDILAQAADDTKSPAAWRSIMNAIYYLRAGRYSTLRAPTFDLLRVLDK